MWKINQIILATTRKVSDKRLIKIAKEKNIDYFTGSEENVLKRFYSCSKKFNADIIVRITFLEKNPTIIAVRAP